MKQVNKAAWMPVGIGAGIAIGAGIGAATDNLAMWLALGVALMGLSGAKRADKKTEEAAPLTDGVPCVNSHHSDVSDGGGGDGGGD